MNTTNKPDDTRDIETPTDEKSHPIAGGAGMVAGAAAGGVAGGAAAGAAVGGITGPVGASIGAAVGAALGGLAGSGAARAVDRDAEVAYWRDNYASRPYAEGTSYDEFGPAYGYGIDAFTRHPGRRFDDVEAELRREWPQARGASSLDWDRARHASRDAWERLNDDAGRALPRDPDRDRR